RRRHPRRVETPRARRTHQCAVHRHREPRRGRPIVRRHPAESRQPHPPCPVRWQPRLGQSTPRPPRRPIDRRAEGVDSHTGSRRRLLRADRKGRRHLMSALTYPLRDSSTMLRRVLRHTTRNPSTLIMAIVLPAVLLLLLDYGFGGAINTGSGRYIDYLIP